MLPRSLVANALTPLLAGPLPEQTGAPFAHVRYDSRQVEPGDLFVALPGERTDGHNFLGDAIGRGAAGLIVRPEQVPDGVLNTAESIAVYPVADALTAFQAIA